MEFLTEHRAVPADAEKRKNPIPMDKNSIARGKTLFEKHCVMCHGPEGRGDGSLAAIISPRPTDLVKMAPHHADGNLAWKIENGRGAMPAWQDQLYETDVWDLAHYIRYVAERYSAE